MLRNSCEAIGTCAKRERFFARAVAFVRTAATFSLVTILTCGSAANAAEIKIFTSRAIATVLDKIGPEFERTAGHRLTTRSGVQATQARLWPIVSPSLDCSPYGGPGSNVVSGFSPIFVKQINAGVAFDVVVSPPSTIDALIKDRHVIADTRTNLVRSGVGVEVRAGAPKPDINSVDAFKRALLSAKSIGYLPTGGVPQLVDRLGIADAIKSKTTIPTSDIVSELVAKVKSSWA